MATPTAFQSIARTMYPRRFAVFAGFAITPIVNLIVRDALIEAILFLAGLAICLLIAVVYAFHPAAGGIGTNVASQSVATRPDRVGAWGFAILLDVIFLVGLVWGVLSLLIEAGWVARPGAITDLFGL